MRHPNSPKTLQEGYRRSVWDNLRAHIRNKALHIAEGDHFFELASGGLTDWYIDLRAIMLERWVRKNAAELLWDLIGHHFPQCEAIAGPMSGACPILIELQNVGEQRGHHEFNVIRVRKEAKDHGVGDLLVGNPKPYQLAVIIEDVITTGGSAQRADLELTEAGLEVMGYVSIVNRDSLLEIAGRPVRSLFYGKELLERPEPGDEGSEEFEG